MSGDVVEHNGSVQIENSAIWTISIIIIIIIIIITIVLDETCRSRWEICKTGPPNDR